MNRYVQNLALVFILIYSLGNTVSAAVSKSAQFPIKISIDNFGVYQLLDKTQQSFSADTTAGYSSVIDTRLVTPGNRVPLKKGVVFGFKFSIADTSTDEEWVPVLIQIKHPPTTNYLGKQSVGFSKTDNARLKADGRYHNGAFYVFSESYEMVAGQWNISVIYRGDMLVSKEFTVME